MYNQTYGQQHITRLADIVNYGVSEQTIDGVNYAWYWLAYGKKYTILASNYMESMWLLKQKLRAA